MEKINDVLCFLNELVFGVELNDDKGQVFEKLRCVKQLLVIEFVDGDKNKPVKVSNIVDDINVLMVTDKNLEKLLEETHSLRENILYLTSVKNFDDNRKKTEN